jgi:uncharacterized protein (TIGR01777 family)
MKTVLISGGSGFIGTRLSKHLRDQGYTVFILSRKPKKRDQIYWNAHSKKIEGKHLNKIEIIINLAGEGIAVKRWSKNRKTEILNSRVETVNFLYLSTGNFPKLEHFISVSGIDCYGFGHDDKVLTETDPFGTNFISEVVKKWEESCKKFESKYRTTILRLPIVLDANKGALPKMASPIKKWVGAPVGTGNQPMNWVHIDDLTAIFSHVIEKNITGIFNVVAGTTLNKVFTQTLAKVLKKPLLLPNIPSFLMKLLLGEVSELLLNGNNISGEKLVNTGFTYRFSNLEKALENTYS